MILKIFEAGFLDYALMLSLPIKNRRTFANG